MIYQEKASQTQRDRFLTWAHWFALVNILLSVVITSIYMVSVPFPETWIGNIYLLLHWLGHSGFIIFSYFVIFILPVCYLASSSRVVRAWSAFAAAIGLAVLALDALFFTKTGSHINSVEPVLWQQQATAVLQTMTWQYRAYLSVLFVIWLTFQLTMANSIWKRLDRLTLPPIARYTGAFMLFSFISSHLMHMWADAKLYTPILQQDDVLPLSYPLTAKTVMTKYGMLDQRLYQQQEIMQFKSRIDGITYPKGPVYCRIDEKPLTLLINTEGLIAPDVFESLNLTQWQQHYDLAASGSVSAFNIVYSLPHIYRQAMTNKLPILFDLPIQLGLPVSFYQHQPLLEFVSLQPYRQSWQQFKQHLVSPKGVSIAFVSSQQLNELLALEQVVEHFNDSQVIITSIGKGMKVSTASNIATGHGDSISHHLDIVPTLLNEAGCQSPAERYSVGQSLLDSGQNWVVNSTEQGLIIQTKGMQTKVYTNGQHISEDPQGTPVVNNPLSMQQLKRGVEKINRFMP